MSQSASQKNVLGTALECCCLNPLTGFYRNGRCETGEDDHGQHTVCTRVTAEFLAFSRAAGNDLSTPMRAYGFPGLTPGDKWCLCMPRWIEALEAGVAPPVDLAGTHESVLEAVPFEVLQANAWVDPASMS